jgi:hypothetical protein
MDSRRDSEDLIYSGLVVAFCAGLVVLGLLGVPALSVAAGGAIVAGLAIFVFRDRLEERSELRERRPGPSPPAARQYVPSVLEGSSRRRRRGVRLRRGHNPKERLRFR